MADPQIVDPALQARVVSQFNLLGPLSPFLLTNRVVPTFDIGKLTGGAPTVVTTTVGQQGIRIGVAGGATYIPTQQVRIDDTDVVDGGTAINSPALTVIVDSGQLPANEHACMCFIGANVPVDFRIEWRNAANAATLASWTILCGGPSTAPLQWGPYNLNFALNERLRIVNVGVVVGTVSSCLSTANVTRSAAT